MLSLIVRRKNSLHVVIARDFFLKLLLSRSWR
jgi:hypothetical protein